MPTRIVGQKPHPPPTNPPPTPPTFEGGLGAIPITAGSIRLTPLYANAEPY